MQSEYIKVHIRIRKKEKPRRPNGTPTFLFQSENELSKLHSLSRYSLSRFYKKENLTLLLQYSLLVSLRQKNEKEKLSELPLLFLLHLQFFSLLSFLISKCQPLLHLLSSLL